MKALPHIAFYTSLSLAVALGAAGCKNNPSSNNATPANQQDQTQTADQSQDPANANVAPVSNASDNTGAPNGAYSSDQNNSNGQNGAYQNDQYSSNGQYDRNDRRSKHPRRHTSGEDEYADNYPSDSYNDNSSYYQPVDYAPQPPPPLPQYDQPPAPGDGYIWTPGYWNWDNSQGYYWAPGAWVYAPYQGALWTPGYWGYTGGRYGWHRGYWGRHVGYYGGINYGFGYGGYGYQGGYWNGDQFAYNRAVNNVNTTVVRNVYNYRVTNVTETRVSYNGGNGGVNVQPRPAEIAAMREQHNPPMQTQMQVVQQARANPQNFARVSHDRPAMVAVSHPVQADRDVKPPAPVRYQAQNQRPNQPNQSAPQQRPNQPMQAQQQRGAPAPNQPQRQNQQEMKAQQQRGEQNRPGANREAQPGNQGHLPARAETPQRPQQPQRQQQTPAGSAQQKPGAERGRVNPGKPEPQHTGPQHPVPQQKAEPNRQETPRGQAQQAAPQQHPAQQGKAQQESKQEQQKKNAEKKQNEDKRPQQ